MTGDEKLDRVLVDVAGLARDYATLAKDVAVMAAETRAHNFVARMENLEQRLGLLERAESLMAGERRVTSRGGTWIAGIVASVLAALMTGGIMYLVSRR